MTSRKKTSSNGICGLLKKVIKRTFCTRNSRRFFRSHKEKSVHSLSSVYKTTKNDRSRKKTFLKVLLQVIFLESLFVFLVVAFQPSAPTNRVFFLYSTPRFLELAILAFATGFAYWGVNKLSNSAWGNKIDEQIFSAFWDEFFIYGGILLTLFSRFSMILLQIFAEGIDLHHLSGYVTQLRPLFFLFSLIGFEIVLWTLFVNQKKTDCARRNPKKNAYLFIALLWSLASIALIFSTFLENIEKRAIINSPIIEWQIFLIWALLTLLILIANPQETIHLSKKTGQHTKMGLSDFAWRRATKIFLIAILIGIIAFVFISTLQSFARPLAKDNFYFQKWSSEDLMQTVSLEDLQKYPLETLNNIHIKPPGFDAIRATMVGIWASEDKLTSLLHVDFLLYKLWSFLYGLLGIILFLWLSKLTDVIIATIASLIFLLHPASILYATLLDSTFLTVFLICLFYYVLWEIKQKNGALVFWLIPIVLSLFFTRAIFQFPFLIITTLSLFVFKVEKQKILVFFLLAGSVMGFYSLKHYNKFGSFSTSSFTGLNLNRSVGNLAIESLWGVDLTLDQQDKSSLPSTLTRTKKVNGQTNFNHINYVEFNRDLIREFKQYVSTTPISQIILSYWDNLQIYFKPSSRYSQNIILEHIFWRKSYERIFSAPFLTILLLSLGAIRLAKLKKEECVRNIGLALPGLYIFAATVLFEKGENMRFKFFIEPLFFVFIVFQIYEIFHWLIQAKNDPHLSINR